MSAKIISAWSRMKNGLFPGDEQILNGDLVIDLPDIEKYSQHKSFEDPNDTAFHIGLLPVPYIGNLATATVYILTLNPGLETGDYLYDQHSLYQELQGNNLRQVPMEYPLFILDPRLSFHSGYAYWVKKFRTHVEKLYKEKIGSRKEILRSISQTVAILELVPYHSLRFPAKLIAKVDQLPSVKMMLEFVQNSIVPRAQNNQATIIITRKVDLWKSPDGVNIIKYSRSGEKHSGSIAVEWANKLGSSGGDAIFNRIKQFLKDKS